MANTDYCSWLTKLRASSHKVSAPPLLTTKYLQQPASFSKYTSTSLQLLPNGWAGLPKSRSCTVCSRERNYGIRSCSPRSQNCSDQWLVSALHQSMSYEKTLPCRRSSNQGSTDRGPNTPCPPFGQRTLRTFLYARRGFMTVRGTTA